MYKNNIKKFRYLWLFPTIYKRDTKSANVSAFTDKKIKRIEVCVEVCHSNEKRKHVAVATSGTILYAL